MRKKKNKKTVADTGYKKVDRKEKKKKEKQEEKRRQKKLSVQQSIAYKEMGRDGICRVQGKTYSKCTGFLLWTMMVCLAALFQIYIMKPTEK